MVHDDIVQAYIDRHNMRRFQVLQRNRQMQFSRNSVAYLSNGTQVANNVPRLEPGKFGKAIMVEEGTTNLLTVNQANGGEDGTTIGFFANWSTTIFNTTEKYWQGSHSIKAVTQGVHEQEGVAVRIPANKLQNGYTYTVSVYVCGIGTVQLAAGATNVTVGTYGYSSVVTLNNNWTRLSLTFIYDATKNPNNYDIGLAVITNIPEAITFYTDGWQLEAKPYATSFVDGTRSAETLTIPTAGVLNPQEGTVECWVYENTTDVRNVSRIIVNGRNATNSVTTLLILKEATKNYYTFRVRNENDTVTVNANSSPLSVGWHHLAAVWLPDTIKLYIDGICVATTPKTFVWSSFNPLLSIGSSLGAGEQFNSLIDDLRISNRARTDAEIAAVYASGQRLSYDSSTTFLFDPKIAGWGAYYNDL